MRKTFEYTYKCADGKEIYLKKSITDRMEPRDGHKKVYCAIYFTEMLKQKIGYITPIPARNLKEV